MSHVQAGAGEPATTGREWAGLQTPLETEPWTETTADLNNVLKQARGWPRSPWSSAGPRVDHRRMRAVLSCLHRRAELISPTWYGSVRDLVVRVLAKFADCARRLV